MEEKKRPTIEEWQSLIHHIIRTKFRWVYAPGRRALLEYDDLVQEGQIALIDAINNYDEARGSFKTYAYVAITNRLSRVAKSSLNQSKYALFSEISEDGQAANFAHCKEASVEESEQEIEWNKSCIERLIKNLGKKKTKALFDHYAKGKKLSDLGKRNNLTGERMRILLQEWLIRAYEILANEED